MVALGMIIGVIFGFIIGFYTCTLMVMKDRRELKRIMEAALEKERKTGKWIFGETLGHSWMKCSECCKSQDGQTLCFTYCPNCGAKMGVEE